MATVAELFPRAVTPVEESVVKAPVPGVTSPIAVNCAAPEVAIPQLASVRARSAEASPIRMTSAAVPPVPMLMVSIPVPVPMEMARANSPPAPKLRAVAAVVPILTVVAVSSPRSSTPAALVSRPTPAATVIAPVAKTSKFV